MTYTPELIREVARRILAFAGDEQVTFHDDRFELEDSRDEQGDLIIVDTRYPGDWSPS